MATTLTRIEQLSRALADKLSADPEEWMGFLRTASKIYLYPFMDQLLIYGQRPDATACASMEIWNRRMNCRIRRGSVGIALIDESSSYRRLRYVFDISDTVKLPGIGKEPFFWELNPERKNEIARHLRSEFMLSERAGRAEELPGVIMVYALEQAQEMMSDLLADLSFVSDGSRIGQMSEEDKTNDLRRMLVIGAMYTILERCGLPGTFDAGHFAPMRSFNTLPVLSVIGRGVQEISAPFLKAIGRYLREYPVIGPDPVEKRRQQVYNEFNTLKRETAKEDQENDGRTQIHPGGRSDDPGPYDDRDETGDRKVRLDAGEIFKAAPAGFVLRHGASGDAGLLPAGGKRGDEGADRKDRIGSPDKGSGTGQSIGSDGLGQAPEHGALPGGGDRDLTDDLRISAHTEQSGQMSLFPLSRVTFPGEREQTHLIYASLSPAEREKIIPDDTVKDILRTGGGKRMSLHRIAAALIKGERGSALASFLKEEYGVCGKGFTIDADPVSIWSDSSGIYLARGTSSLGKADRYLSWLDAAAFVQGMYEEGSFVSAEVFSGALSNERKEMADALYFLLRDGLGKLPDVWKTSADRAIAQIADVLKDAGKAGMLYHAYLKTKDRLIENGQRGGYFLTHCDRCLERIRRLSLPDKRILQTFEGQMLSLSFITGDEVDALLRSGSGFENGKRRIYRFFKEGHEAKEEAEFLKKEYGIGGRSSALPGSDSFMDHDGKGITVSKGQITKPDVKLLIRWSEAAKRIRQLIEDEKYLSEEEMLYYREEEALRLDKERADKERMEEQAREQEEAPSVTAAQVAAASVMIAAGNFHITDMALGRGSAKEKYAANIAAIRLLKTLEAENRQATEPEQEILAGYVGWGGLPDAFDPDKDTWHSQYEELRGLLTDAEYESARGSVLNAQYTQPLIIDAMYQALSDMGFTKGNLLEPSMGIGNFFGMLPQSMAGAKLYGAELDDISGRIAKKLYPDARIEITGYEKTQYPSDFFDAAIGNVPFGNYGVNDRKYNGRGFLIHDYFLAKTVDLLRPGGVMAFITTKGTMDKENDHVRRYLSGRATLLGAIRLPNNAFYDNAGTKVTSDILFFQKRENLSLEEQPWLSLSSIRSDEGDEIKINAYFAAHPEMILGKMAFVSGPFGPESACLPTEGADLGEQLREAITHIHGKIQERDTQDEELTEGDEYLPADLAVRNYSYTAIDDRIYYRENSIMRPVSVSDAAAKRLMGLINIQRSVRRLIDLQMAEDTGDEVIREEQENLNALYDAFTAQFGLINSPANKRAFSEDSSYCLLCSLEILKEDGTLERKADMFTKRTIKKPEIVSYVETAQEALVISINEKAMVDLPFMAKLCKKSEEQVAGDLTGVIFKNPATSRGEAADEYLSGNVREKLKIAQDAARRDGSYQVNIESLQKVIPKDLTASEIEVRLGATWIEPADYMAFMEELLHTPSYMVGRTIDIQYSPISGQWNISGKNADSYHNVLVTATYGTDRVNAYYILEQSLNLKNVQVFDSVTVDGQERRVLNKKETMLAGQKQEAMKEAFREWIFKDQARRERITKVYNEKFNAIRPREYDGSHLPLPGMNPEMELRPHQNNAVAHQLYGGNTLLAHVVGAGKTYEMVAAAMEGKRLGLCQKSLFVVPNHLTGQWGAEFLQLYPGANILVATKRDFEPSRRKEFCGRIALGEYDAVIIGHSQFEKIPLSIERQQRFLRDQIDEITQAISALKWRSGERFSVKEMEKTRKGLQARLEKLTDIKQDDVVTFEQLGVDHLYVDEAHYYKNAFLYTKMRNVAGISQTEAMKSADMMNKCRYMDEITGGRGITFATGTPISNSMTELYIMQRYLQRGRLSALGLDQFDAWASTFGEVVTAVELSPEGTGYRTKSRFAKFYNIPELMSLFKEIADIKTADQLLLPVPEAKYETVVLKPSEIQKEIVSSLADRAEAVRNGAVDSSVDNMLRITNDGRKAALDQRLMNPLLPDDPGSKVNECAKRCFDIWDKTKEKRLTQLVFCDLSTPREDGEFSVYADLKKKLVERGIPEGEIAFIHDAKSDAKKAELFARMRKGQVRILMGSTAKMGAGTNVQTRLIALHHLDIGWRPSDLEQREGRIIRQGNCNEKVQIYRYVTENTFDSYLWQIIESKQRFISQIMTSKAPVRSCEDVDETALSYAEVKALATGNPEIKEKMELDVEVTKLKLLRSNFISNRYRLEDEIVRVYPAKISSLTAQIRDLEQDIALLSEKRSEMGDDFRIEVMGTTFEEKKEAGAAILALCKQWSADSDEQMPIGEYLGFKLGLSFNPFESEYILSLSGSSCVRAHLGKDPFGVITRMNNALDTLPRSLETVRVKLSDTRQQLLTAKEEVTKEFPRETEYQEKQRRLAELNAKLSVDDRDGGQDEGQSLVAEKQEAYGGVKKTKAL